MSERVKILMIEHEPSDIDLIRFELDNSALDYDSKLAQNENEVMEALENFSPDIILSDFKLPSFDGITALQLSQKISPLTPFIFVSGTLGEETSVELIKRGATDYALKDKLYSLPPKIKRALKEANEKRDKLIAENERIKITADLIQRNNDLEQFAYIVSHNLRAPVANILGFADMFNNFPDEEQKRKILIEGLLNSTKKLDTVITDLNIILQVKKEKNEKKEVVRFSDIVNDVEVSIGNIIAKEGVKIEQDFTEVNELFTLRSYLHSIFYNLISNSIKYRQPGLPSVIKIKSYRKENTVELTFEDNGLGIDLERKSKEVFGLYKRFHPQIEGKGMGLFMVKTQVEILGGKISVTSQMNKGTRFKLEFEAPPKG